MKKQKTKIRYAIADDHAVFRRGVVLILNQYPDLEFTCEAENGSELMMKLVSSEVDVALLDISMPIQNGLETAEKIGELYPEMGIIMLSMHDEESMISHAVRKGANGFILKNADPEVIADAMRSVAHTGYYFNDIVTPSLIRKMVTDVRPTKQKKQVFELSERELTIIKLICEEMTSAEIADKLHLSVRTVEGNRQTMMDKLGVKSIAGLVAYAYKNGIMEI